MNSYINRREFTKLTTASMLTPLIGQLAQAETTISPDKLIVRKDYQGPNIIIVRFGGGVRRRETIMPEHTYCPYFLHELSKQGTLFTNMEISNLDGVETSHGQGTLYIITGRYDEYKDVGEKFLGQRFEPKVPTLFEYLRRFYTIPPHQTLIINGEDRTDEEFYTFSNHHLFGNQFRSNVLSLYRYKVYLLRQQIAEGKYQDEMLEKKQAELQELESIDYRLDDALQQSEQIDAFWENWRSFYGESGFVNPRGDQLLTELALRAMDQLQPRLMMINYNDPDYVHWGNPTHYTRGISMIDQGIKQICDFAQNHDHYGGNTVFAIVPDCGRDSNTFVPVPFQHHFNSKSSHEIFALLIGPGIAKNVVIDKLVDQISIAPTLGYLASMPTDYTEGDILEDAII